MWVERITGVFEERLVQGREPAYVTHCLLNNSLRDSLAIDARGAGRPSASSRAGT